MQTLSWVVRVAIAVVFLVSSTGKLRSPASFAAVLLRLGLPARTTGPVAVAVSLVELVCAVAVVAFAGSWVVGVTVAALGLAFGAAGVAGVLSSETITCNCLGGSGSTLGRRQILLAPVWVVAGLLSLADPGEVTVLSRLIILSWIVLAVAAVNVARLQRRVQIARGYRHASEASLGGKPDLFEGMEREALER